MRGAAFIVATFLVFGTVPSLSAADATITIVNDSSWDIHHLFISPTAEARWGPDQLGRNVLESGMSITITDIECAEYDIRIIDEDGDECILTEIPMCQDDSEWIIDDDELLSCEGFGN